MGVESSFKPPLKQKIATFLRRENLVITTFMTIHTPSAHSPFIANQNKGLSFPSTAAGCDEAGRGALAGPVVAAAVVLPATYSLPSLTDSKKLTPKMREILAPAIKRQALAWGVGMATVAEIEEQNILQATFLAMHRAIDAMLEGAKATVDHLFIDGNRFKAYPAIPHTCIVRGDATVPAIAAASILAKTARDSHMALLAADFPHYGWVKNKGYPTAAHKQVLKRHGCSIHHRQSYKPCALVLDAMR